MLRLFAVLAVAIAGVAVASSVSAYTPNPEDLVLPQDGPFMHWVPGTSRAWR